MKYSLLVLFLFFSNFVFAKENTQRMAKELNIYINMYESSLTFLQEASNSKPISESEITERDLAICLQIGLSDKNFSEVFSKANALGSASNNNQDGKILDELTFKLSRGSLLLFGYCARYYSEKHYRDLNEFKSSVIKQNQLLIDLRKYIEKFL